MPTFALSLIQDIKGPQQFYELMVDGIRPMKAFRNEILSNPKLMGELEEAYAIMDSVAHLHSLPKVDFHPLRNPSRDITEYEIKTKNIRIYCFKIQGGKLIVLACLKKPSAQDRQIQQFRNLKNAYLDSIQNEKE